MNIFTWTLVLAIMVHITSGSPTPDYDGEPNTEDCMKALTSTSVTGFQSSLDTLKAGGDFVKFCIVECYKIVVKTINVGSAQVDEVIEEGKVSSPISTLQEGSKLVDCFFWCLQKLANAVKTGTSGIFKTTSQGASAGKTALKTANSFTNFLD